MNPPKKIKVGPRVYTVDMGGPDWEEEMADANGFLYGACAHRKLKIVLRPDLHPFQLRSTLWHEVLHACVNTAGDLIDNYEGPDKEEFVVSVLESITFQVVVENPRLVAFMASKS